MTTFAHNNTDVPVLGENALIHHNTTTANPGTSGVTLEPNTLVRVSLSSTGNNRQITYGVSKTQAFNANLCNIVLDTGMAEFWTPKTGQYYLHYNKGTAASDLSVVQFRDEA